MGFPSDLQGWSGQRRPDRIKVSKFQIRHHFWWKITALIHKNVIEMFVRFTYFLKYDLIHCAVFLWIELFFNVVWVLNQKLIEQLFCSLFAWWYDTPLRSRFLMVSTNQADPSCFYFRISWILMEWRWFYFFFVPSI